MTRRNAIKETERIIMKVRFKENIATRSGKSKFGNTVFVTVKGSDVGYERKYVYPTLTAQNKLSGLKLKASGRLWHLLPEGFKSDCQRYAVKYNKQHLEDDKLPIKAINVFTKAVCKHNAPIESLEELAEILGNSIREWIERGYLRKVKRWDVLRGEIV
jgi:hypothetical protein